VPDISVIILFFLNTTLKSNTNKSDVVQL